MSALKILAIPTALLVGTFPLWTRRAGEMLKEMAASERRTSGHAPMKKVDKLADFGITKKAIARVALADLSENLTSRPPGAASRHARGCGS